MRGVSVNVRRLFNMQPNHKVIGLLSLATLLILSLLFVRPVSAAVAYRNFSTANNGGGTTSISLTMPTSTVSGDVMIAVLSIRGGTSVTSVTPATGWQLIDTRDSTTTIKSQVYYGVRDTVGAGPYGFTFAPATAQKASAVVTSYSGVDVAQPVDVFASQANASSAVIATPSITTTQANTMLVGAHSTAVGTTYSSSTMTYHTGAIASSTGGGGGTRSTSVMQDSLQAAAGPSGAKSMTVATAAINIGHLIALRPAPIISQASYRFFQNTNSTTASTPLAAKDAATTVEKGVPFRIRLNLGVGSGGSSMTAVASRQFKLQFALKSGTCGTFYDLASPLTFYNNATPADGVTYVADGANDPFRVGITPIGQKYHESNPLTLSADTQANQDALWDVSLNTLGVSYGETYCLRVVNADGSVLSGGYTAMPEFTIATPTASQANYRWFANANSVTPGSPLAAQDTAATVTSSTPFRLRQRLAVGAASLPLSGQNYKLQYAEKVGVCDAGFSGESYADISGGGSSGSLSGYAASASDDGSAGVVPWSNVASATGSSDSASATASTDSVGVASTRLALTNFGLNVPTGATITGITVRADRSNLLDPGTSADEFEIRLVKAGAIQGVNRARSSTAWANAAGDWGGSADLWGSTWTPADINASNFGVSLSAGLTGDPVFGNFASANVDSVQITVAYTVAGGNPVAFSDNVSVASPSTIATIAGDPTNASRPTVYQSYRETDPFTNNVGAIPNGSDGLWDFALTSTAAANGKTYCIRTVKSDGTPLDSYTQIPEVTFTSGVSAPTTEQKLRGGRSVISGVKSPFEL